MCGGKEDDEECEPLKYDPHFKGPVTNRSCTDVICCIVFIIFIAGFAVVSYFAFTRGDYKVLLYPMDSDKQLCGYGALLEKPNLLFFDITRCATPVIFLTGCPTKQICVEHCPNVTGISSSEINPYCEGSDCPPYVVASKPFVGRCIPDLGLLGNAVGSAITSQVNMTELTTTSKFITKILEAKAYADKIISDVVVSWWIILICLIGTMIVSFIWIVLMRWVAGVMVWLGIILFLILFGAGCGISVWKYIQVKDSTKEVHVGFNPLVFTFSESKLYLTLCIIAGILFLVFLLILIALFSRIRIAIALIKEGSRAIGNIISTLLWPLIPFILQIAVVVYWLAVAVNLFAISRSAQLHLNDTVTSDEITDLVSKIACANDTGSVKSCYVVQNMQSYTLYLQIYAVFVFFWMVNFVTALGQLTLAGTFASYYWSFNKPKDIPSFPLFRAFYRCFRYHLGSIAFGSLIIALVQMIRLFLEYVDQKLKDVDNPVAKFTMKCLKCCFWCLEKFLRFLNKNAYIMIAVHGKNFCVSAKDAFMLILRNVARTVVIDKATDFVLLMSRLVIVCAIAVASYFIFSQKLPVNSLNDTIGELHFYLVPIVVIIIGAYIITDCFFSVYEMAVDTLFLCFLEDLEKHDGSAEKPYFMNKSLMKILGKKNKAEKAEAEAKE